MQGPYTLDEGRFAGFLAVYEEELTRATINYPDEYMHTLEGVPEVVARMAAAMRAGTFNKDGRAIRAAMRRFNLPHTYKAFYGYLTAGEGAAR